MAVALVEFRTQQRLAKAKYLPVYARDFASKILKLILFSPLSILFFNCPTFIGFWLGV